MNSDEISAILSELQVGADDGNYFPLTKEQMRDIMRSGAEAIVALQADIDYLSESAIALPRLIAEIVQCCFGDDPRDAAERQRLVEQILEMLRNSAQDHKPV